jgi:hypothetical protein
MTNLEGVPFKLGAGVPQLPRYGAVEPSLATDLDQELAASHDADTLAEHPAIPGGAHPELKYLVGPNGQQVLGPDNRPVPVWDYHLRQAEYERQQQRSAERARRRTPGYVLGRLAVVASLAVFVVGGWVGVSRVTGDLGQPAQNAKVWVQPTTSTGATATTHSTPTPKSTSTPAPKPTTPPTPVPTHPPAPTVTPTPNNGPYAVLFSHATPDQKYQDGDTGFGVCVAGSNLDMVGGGAEPTTDIDPASLQPVPACSTASAESSETASLRLSTAGALAFIVAANRPQVYTLSYAA